MPAELGGSDAPREMLAEDPELEQPVLGRTTGSDEPATEDGVDLSAGDDADAAHGRRARRARGRGAGPEGRRRRRSRSRTPTAGSRQASSTAAWIVTLEDEA